MEREYKTFPAIEHKILDDDQGIVEHFVAITGNRDLGNDRIISGAFRKTIIDRGLQIKVLDQHRTDSIQAVIGKPLSMQEVGRDQLPPYVLGKFPDATGGLKVTTQYLMDTPEGRGAFLRIKSGAVGEYSIGYDAMKGATSFVKDKDGQTERHLKEIKLWEYSPVIFGMNPATTTLSAKEADPGDADEGEESEPDANEDVKNSPTYKNILEYMESGQAYVSPPGTLYGLPMITLPDLKFGRTISAATRAKLMAARDVIDELCSMGETEDTEDEDEPEEMKSAPGGVPQAADNQQQPQAGPVSPPTSKSLLLEIEIGQEQLKHLEV